MRQGDSSGPYRGPAKKTPRLRPQRVQRHVFTEGNGAPERSRTPNPQITNRAAERLHRAETQRRDRPPEAQPQQAFDHSRSSCPTNDPYNSAPSLPQLNLSHRIATSSASARAEGCAWRARRGVPGFSPRGTPARACRWAFLITGRFVTQR